MVDASICFIAVSGVALVQFGILEPPSELLLQWLVEERLGLLPSDIAAVCYVINAQG